MLRVKTKVNLSPIHGLGLFADEFIPKDTVTWLYDPIFDPAFTEVQITMLSEVAKSFLYYYTYYDKDLNKFILCSDNLKYINHSFKNINIKSTPRKDIALRDIFPDEELICNYNGFDPEYFKRLNLDIQKLVD